MKRTVTCSILIFTEFHVCILLLEHRATCHALYCYESALQYCTHSCCTVLYRFVLCYRAGLSALYTSVFPWCQPIFTVFGIVSQGLLFRSTRFRSSLVLSKVCELPWRDLPLTCMEHRSHVTTYAWDLSTTLQRQHVYKSQRSHPFIKPLCGSTAIPQAFIRI